MGHSNDSWEYIRELEAQLSTTKEILKETQDNRNSAWGKNKELEARLEECLGALKKAKQYLWVDDFASKEVGREIDSVLTPHSSTLKRIEAREAVMKAVLSWHDSPSTQEKAKRYVVLAETLATYKTEVSK